MSRVNRRIDIYLMNADGSDIRPLTTGDGSFSSAIFSPDGSQIAYLRSDAYYEEIHDIWIMDADGTNQRPLTTTSIEYDPHFSPDGQWITFVSGRDKVIEIYRMRADGSEQQRLTFTEDDPEHRIGPPLKNLSPRYLADGAGIVFVGSSLRPSTKPEHSGKVSVGAREIHRIDAEGTGRSRLTTVAGGCDDLVVSADGNRAAFWNTEPAENVAHSLCVVDKGGSLQARQPSFAGDYYMAFHPAGDRIVFTSFRDRKVERVTRNQDLYAVRIDDGQLERLTDNTALDTVPTFSPDGKQVVFSSDRDGTLEIYCIPYEG